MVSTEEISFDTGALLKAYCKKKRIYKAALSRKTGIGYQSLLYYLKSQTIDVDKLVKLSHGLSHNFLLDIALQLPASYTNDAPIDSTKEDEIKLLNEQIKILQAEKDILLKALAGK